MISKFGIYSEAVLFSVFQLTFSPVPRYLDNARNVYRYLSSFLCDGDTNFYLLEVFSSTKFETY